MSKVFRQQSGFTLIELIIGSSLMIMLLTALFLILGVSIKSWHAGRGMTESQQVVRHAVDCIARDIKYAESININGPSSIDIRTNKYGVSNQLLTYFIDTTATQHILRINRHDGSGSQPITGESTTPVSIDIEFTDLSGIGATKTVGILCTATELNTGQQFIINTAVTSLVLSQ